MEELFQVLSASARFGRNKNRKSSPRKETGAEDAKVKSLVASSDAYQFDEVKAEQLHREQIAHFRRSLHIRVNRHDPTIPDPVSSFHDVACPTWWLSSEAATFDRAYNLILSNVENGKWKEPTAIQMQAIPSLVARRDTIGSSPTGSGKTGAFILPLILLSKASNSSFYGVQGDIKARRTGRRSPLSLILAPSLELASQLTREVERLAKGLNLRCCLLGKSNAAQAISGEVGGSKGLDVLVATPLRLVDCIEKGLALNELRIVVLDEADRMLDAADGQSLSSRSSGSSHSKTFTSQVDRILSEIPATSVRALFSATVTPAVRSMAESILRSPVDITIQATSPGGANPNIAQKLLFVGKEEGKLLAIRQLVARGELKPPTLVFCQSQDRAQALFEELLYDRIHVDVLHAGRSNAARERSVENFRKGYTWLLICTDLVARGVDFRAVNMVINYDLPESGVTYIHRIGRTGRAGRTGEALSLFTEADFDHLRTIANIMRQSGCHVEEWMLNLRRSATGKRVRRHRLDIDTTPKYDRNKRRKVRQMVAQSRDDEEQQGKG